MKIKEIMQHLKNRELPCVSADSDIREVIKTAVRFPHTRLVYVIDDHNRLLGAITIGALIRHLYPYNYADRIHPRDILRNVVVEKAAHLMSHSNVNARPEESVDTVLKRMAATGAKEIAVVDGQGCILADITAVDLLNYYTL